LRPCVLGRRALLGLGLAALAGSSDAMGLGRTRLGGKLTFSLPWALGSIDPHDAFDPAAALLGGALFDTLFAADPRAGVRASLAEALPTKEAGITTVKLRHGLRTSRGKALDAGDVLASFKRARARGAAPLLEPLGEPTRVASDPFALQFPKAQLAAVTRAFASPVTAIVARAFDPKAPDGTGPFAATLRGGAVELTRNVASASGAAFLERLAISSAQDLRESLRDFEAERDDLGWLGSGVFGSRKDAVRFDLGAVALVVLAAQPSVGPAGRPGALQALVNAVPRGKLAHLGLGTLPAGRDAAAWDGADADLWVDAGAPHLVEVAEALADALSRPDHTLTVRTARRDEVLAKRRKGDASLSLHVVRPLGSGSFGALLGLALLDDPARAKELAKVGSKIADGRGVRDVTSELRVAVVGEVRVAGAIVPGVTLASAHGGGWDLGATHLDRAAP
jgi:peptide/nickel transport system substrate-binding protein